MAIEPPHRRTSRTRSTSYRRRLLARQHLPRMRRERPIFRRRNRWTPTRLCFSAAAALLVGAMSFSLLSSPFAVADIDAEKRAAQDVAAMQADVSQEQRAISFEVPAIEQYPELPTGCESVALTNTLLSLGFELEKTEIADAWLPRSDSDFVTAFMGDPHATDGHSCMAPAIAQTAAAYLATQGSSLEAVDLTGSSLEEVLGEVAVGNPVIAWCTIGLADPGTAYQVERAGDRTYRLYANSHCVVVSGYDLDSGVVLVSDSLAGQVSYDLQQFAARYYELGAQAVVIK
ncbi:C39 family peptidase [Eggerthella timonensis]|uniref:C39 family peptidase n=1 Tax=Eggerthella timonensis TaxID=1871008 RepID=UPI000C76A3F1|nr:C39 family peptidase [Eggerthella timonensis]